MEYLTVVLVTLLLVQLVHPSCWMLQRLKRIGHKVTFPDDLGKYSASSSLFPTCLKELSPDAGWK